MEVTRLMAILKGCLHLMYQCIAETSQFLHYLRSKYALLMGSYSFLSVYFFQHIDRWQ
jgi:hypothetical protein